MSQASLPSSLSPSILVTAPEFEIAAVLREWRQRRAREEEVPAYVVLPNRLLQEIARCLPQNEEGLRQLKGMGPARMSRYGAALLDVLRELGAVSARASERPESEPRPHFTPATAEELAEEKSSTEAPGLEATGAVESQSDPVSPAPRETVSYRVVIEYHLEDEARRRLAQELSSGGGPISSALAGALSGGPSRVCVRVESDRVSRV